MIKGDFAMKFVHTLHQMCKLNFYVIFFRTLLAIGYHISMDAEKKENNRLKMIKLGNE